MRQSDVNRYFTMSEAEIATPFPLPKLPAYEPAESKIVRIRSNFEFAQRLEFPKCNSITRGHFRKFGI